MSSSSREPRRRTAPHGIARSILPGGLAAGIEPLMCRLSVACACAGRLRAAPSPEPFRRSAKCGAAA